jgi:hypothetical protein
LGSGIFALAGGSLTVAFLGSIFIALLAMIVTPSTQISHRKPRRASRAADSVKQQTTDAQQAGFRTRLPDWLRARR